MVHPKLVEYHAMPQYQKQETGGCENTMLLLSDFILLNNVKTPTYKTKQNNKPKPMNQSKKANKLQFLNVAF